MERNVEIINYPPKIKTHTHKYEIYSNLTHSTKMKKTFLIFIIILKDDAF